jgi:hypothetical protein
MGRRAARAYHGTGRMTEGSIPRQQRLTGITGTPPTAYGVMISAKKNSRSDGHISLVLQEATYGSAFTICPPPDANNCQPARHRTPGDIMSDHQAKSSRNARATSSESAALWKMGRVAPLSCHQNSRFRLLIECEVMTIDVQTPAAW